MLTRAAKRRTGRDDSGETLVSVIVAMVITGLVMPAVLHMIYVTAQMAAAQPVHDPAVAATSQMQSMLAEIDPVRVCLTPAGTGRRDQCLTTSEAVGASLVQPPPDALKIDPMTICWLARPDNPETPSPRIETGLKTQCLMLRDDGNDTPFAPNARREISEIDRQTSAVDPRGGDELIVRTYDIAVPPGGDPAVAAENYLLPVAGAQSWADQVLYFDAEWWCLRWRHPKNDVDGSIVGRWIGNCPCPADTFEQIPLPATVKTLTDPDTNPLTTQWVPPPVWSDTDGVLTSGSTPDDGDPYDSIAELISATGTCDRVAATRSDGTVNPDHCDASAAVGTLPGVPILSGPPVAGDDCATDAWWNPRYSTETVGLRGYLLPAAAVPAGGGPPVVLSRVASLEIRVCVATTADTRNRGGAHCELDTMRFALPGFDRLSTSSVSNPVTLSLSLTALNTLENTSGRMDVALTTPPVGPVSVTVTSADPTVATVSPAMLTFTPGNYSNPQTVTIDGVVDADALDDTTTVTLTAAGGGYSAVSISVPVTVTEPQPPALIVMGPATMAENATDTFTVALATQPTATVTVTPASDDTNIATVSGPLTFTPGNYSNPQTVTVTGVHDTNAADDTANVTLTAGGADYATVTASMAVTVTDIDTPTLTLNKPAVTMAENATDTFTVALATQPAATVTVAPASDDTNAATVSPPMLTFTPGNYSNPQTVIVSGVHDTNAADDTATVTLTAGGADYATVTASVAVTVTDIDTPTLTLNKPAVTMEENATDTFTVALATQPAATVTVAPASDDTNVATVSPPMLTFTPGNYSNPQTVTVTGVADADTADDTATVTLTAGGADYATVTASVAVTVTEPPLPALIVMGDPVTAAENSTGTFTVALLAQPTATVTVAVMSDNPNVATVSTSALTFTPGDYSLAQTVTVTGVHDTNAGDDTASVTLTATGGNYAGITASVTVTVTDIDPVATNQPGTPTNSTVTCTATGATVTWNAPGNQPTIYEVEIDFYGSPTNANITVFVSHPTTSADFDLNNGVYVVRALLAHNSAGASTSPPQQAYGTC